MKKIISLLVLLMAICASAQPGSLDTTFNPGTGANHLSTITTQSDGKILIGGYFSSYNGVATGNIARVNKDGSLDTTFNPGTGTDWAVSAIVVQPDSKILVGGHFAIYNGTPKNQIIRLKPDGSVDTSFNCGALQEGTYSKGYCTAICRQSDGKILVGGYFTIVNGVSRSGIARLNSDGSLDTGFNPIAGASGEVNSIAVQSDGKILIGGTFSGYNGIGRNKIARLNSDGSLDLDFNPGTGADNYIYSVAVQPDGKILLGGLFRNFNGSSQNGISRLNSDGSLDTGFKSGTALMPANSYLNSITIQPDGNILIGGYFTSFDGVTQDNLARLKTDGSLDTTFNQNTELDAAVKSITLQQDGKILIGGFFYNYAGYTRNGIARLNSDLSLGIADVAPLKSIQLYPNPVSDVLTIDFQGNPVVETKIYDTLGKCVKSMTSFDNRIDVSSLQEGVYILRTIDNNNEVYMSKFIKK